MQIIILVSLSSAQPSEYIMLIYNRDINRNIWCDTSCLQYH